MGRLLVGVFASLLGAALLPATAVAMSPGECDELSIRIKDLPEAALARCESSNIGGGGDQGSGIDEFIQLVTGNAVFIVSHASVGRHTYLRRLTVRDTIGQMKVFGSVDSWGEEAESGPFDIRRFDAKLRTDGQHVACFGFSHYAGHVARTTGYRHHISGFYCDLAGSPPTDARIDQLVGSIDYDFD